MCLVTSRRMALSCPTSAAQLDRRPASCGSWISRPANLREVSSRELALGTTWSPDGQWIVGSSADRFVVVRPNGADLYELRVPANVRFVGGPSFSPDGTRLVFFMRLAGAPNNDIYTMKLDGTDLVQLTKTPDDNEYFTDWGIEPR